MRSPRKNNTVDDRISDIAGVINEMNLQTLVVEGPDRVGELQLFFDRFLLRIMVGIRAYCFINPFATPSCRECNSRSVQKYFPEI